MVSRTAAPKCTGSLVTAVKGQQTPATVILAIEARLLERRATTNLATTSLATTSLATTSLATAKLLAPLKSIIKMAALLELQVDTARQDMPSQVIARTPVRAATVLPRLPTMTSPAPVLA